MQSRVSESTVVGRRRRRSSVGLPCQPAQLTPKLPESRRYDLCIDWAEGVLKQWRGLLLQTGGEVGALEHRR